jgi:hypothetical protein
MAILETQTIQQTGLTPVLSACSSGGDQFEPSEETVLLVKNSDASAHTVTVVVVATDFSQPVQDVTITVPAASLVLAGVFPPGEVAAADGLATLTYDDASPLSIAVLAT